MPKPACEDQEFIPLFASEGPAAISRRFGISIRNVLARRTRLEGKLNIRIEAPARRKPLSDHPQWLTAEIENGVVLVGSDPHYWPGEPSTAHRGFVRACRELQPAIVVLNGDILDAATISRFAPIGWEDRPTLVQEIEACQTRLNEIVLASGQAKRYWPLGNHDARFETRLATVAPEFAKVRGVHLQDHFPGWEPCWALCINDDVVIKHRFRGGIHATHNNVLWSGKTIVTGHLHNLNVKPLSDYNGTRWGVDAGTLADLYGPQFRDYTEQNPLNWRPGFVVLTFHDGRLLWPDVAHVMEQGKMSFRGKTYEV